MRYLEANSVSQALAQMLFALLNDGHKADSRNGAVLTLADPVITEYTNPTNRVLWNDIRRPNPFFHLMESLWMLQGRNDLKFLTYFNSRMASYSDDGGKTQPAGYGHRWIEHFDSNQIDFAIRELIQNPNSRRVVIGMWDPNTDIEAVTHGGADVPCNTQVYFRTRPNGRLDMTVTCRSNDALWGATGANVVHFSMLHEYIALSTGLKIGSYYHLSNDLHVYTDIYDEPTLNEMVESIVFKGDDGIFDASSYLPLIGAGETRQLFDLDLQNFFDNFDETGTIFLGIENCYETEFFNKVVQPMALAWTHYKAGEIGLAISVVQVNLLPYDWGQAALRWLETSKLNK